MDYLIWIFIWILMGYIFGSLPIGYLIGKLKGIDLRKAGSGSTGATNVLRNIGIIPALITLLLDVVKGFLPVFFVVKLSQEDLIVVLVAFACIVGHSRSIFLGFKGGKSSATGLGVVFAISWQTAVISFLIWFVVVMTSRYSSLGSIVALPLVPVWLLIFTRSKLYFFLGITVAVYIVLIRHRDNIKRLLKGIEPKLRA